MPNQSKTELAASLLALASELIEGEKGASGQVAPENPSYNKPKKPPEPKANELEESTPGNPAKGGSKNPQLAADNPSYNKPSSPPAPADGELEESTPGNPAKGSDKNPQAAPDNAAYNSPKKPKPVAKAAKKPPKEADDDDEDDEDTDDEEEDAKHPTKCGGKRKSVEEPWSKALIYDFIKEKSLSLDYNPNSDCFTFKHACELNSTINLDAESPADDLVFTGMKSLNSPRRTMEPTDSELEKINCFTSQTLSKDDVRIITIKAADTNIDRSSEKFSKKALEDMAALSINKPIMNDHRIHDVAQTFGNIFDAKVVHTKEGPVLFQKAYVLNVPEFQHTIKCIAAGIGSKASVHFKTPREQYLCSACNKTMFSEKGFCGHYVGYSKNADGSVVMGINNRVVDFLETTRTAAPDAPGADMKMLSDTEFTNKTVKTGTSAPQMVQGGLISIAKAIGRGIFGDSSTLNQVNPGNGAKTMPDETNKEDLGKFVEAVTQLHGSVGGFSNLIESQKSVTEGQNKLVNSMITTLQSEKTAREMEVKEMKDRFDVLFAYQVKQAELLDSISAKLDAAASKSMDDLVHKIAAIAPNTQGSETMDGMSVEEKEKSLRDNQYKSIFDTWISKHSK